MYFKSEKNIVFLLIIPVILLLAFNIKFVYFTASIFICFILSGRGRMISFFTGVIKESLWAAIFLISLLSYSLYITTNIHLTLLQARDLTIFFLVIIIFKSMIIEKGDKELVIKLITNVLCLLSILKVIVVIYSFITGMPIDSILKFLNINTMTLNTDVSYISRLQFPVDSIIPFALYFHVYEIINKNKSFKSIAILFLLMFSLMMTMSRGFWLTGLLMIFWSVVVNSKLRTKIKVIFISFLIFGSIYLFFHEFINSVIETRLNSGSNIDSDAIRYNQYLKISSQISISPLLGHGLGYSIPSFARVYGDRAYQYELQSYALIMNIGFLGFVLFILTVIHYSSIVKLLIKNVKLSLTAFIFIIIWFLTGSVNPILLNVTGGLMIFFTYLLTVENS